MRRFVLICASVSSVLSLTACSMGDPMPIGRGYSSYKQPYKSAPGADARDVGYDYSNSANKAVINNMRYTAQDLVEKLEDKLSFNVDNIYLATPSHTAFYNSMDHLIREELTKRGYVLSTSPVDSVHVELFAKDAVPQCKDENLYVGLAINVVDRIPSDVVGGYYNVPDYDYVPAGSLKLSVPACQIED